MARAALPQDARPAGAKSVFPDVDYAPIAEAFGFQARPSARSTISRRSAPLLAKPDGPLFLDCKLNAAVAAPFMSEFHEFEDAAALREAEVNVPHSYGEVVYCR
jgi:hypothetical protein